MMLKVTAELLTDLPHPGDLGNHRKDLPQEVESAACMSMATNGDMFDFQRMGFPR